MFVVKDIWLFLILRLLYKNKEIYSFCRKYSFNAYKMKDLILD